MPDMTLQPLDEPCRFGIHPPVDADMLPIASDGGLHRMRSAEWSGGALVGGIAHYHVEQSRAGGRSLPLLQGHQHGPVEPIRGFHRWRVLGRTAGGRRRGDRRRSEPMGRDAMPQRLGRLGPDARSDERDRLGAVLVAVRHRSITDRPTDAGSDLRLPQLRAGHGCLELEPGMAADRRSARSDGLSIVDGVRAQLRGEGSRARHRP